MGCVNSCIRPRPSTPPEGYEIPNRPHPQGGPPSTAPGQGTGTHQAGPSDFSAMLQSQQQQSRPSSPAPAGAAPGRGPTAPATPAHTSGQAWGVASAGPSAPHRTPIDGVHIHNSPFGGPNQNQTVQYIRDLDAASPSFHNTLSAATNNGRNSLDFNYGAVSGGPLRGGQGEYNSDNHSVTIDPFHPLNANVGRMQGAAAFEIHNAANRQNIQDMGARRDNGSYEQRANQYNAANPDAHVTGARIYAQDHEHQEWLNAKQTHQAMTEGAQQGLQAPPVFGNKFEAPPAGGQAPWADFQSYQREQWLTGHTQQYMTNYQDRMTELGQGGPSASPPSPSPSFGEPGPEA